MTRPTVSAAGLTLSYRGTPAVDDVTLRLSEGVTGLLGPNGAGKTTLLRVLATATPPDHGAFTVLGHDPSTVHGRQDARRVLGYLPQNPGFHPDFTAFEFIDYVAILKELTDRRAGPAGSSTRSASRRCVASGYGGSPAACGSAWRSPRPWSATRASWSWTNRRSDSTPNSACGSGS